MQDVKLQIEGMSCGGCVRNLTSALEAVPGVQIRQVEIGSAEVAIDPGKASIDDVKRAVQKRGFQVSAVR